MKRNDTDKTTKIINSEPKHKKFSDADIKKKKIVLVCICILIIAIIAGVLAGVFIVKKKNSAKKAVPTQSKLTYTLADNRQKLAEFKTKNNDAVAWLEIPDSNVNDPVVQAKDNDFYLRKTELKKYNVYGCYFADYECSVGPGASSLSENTIIYGHSNTRENPNGKKFEQLFKYRDIEFLKKNPIIFLSLQNENVAFEVFAVFYTTTDFYYITTTPLTDDFDDFTKQIYDKNEYVFNGGKITKNDKILTLSTCAFRYDKGKTGNHRFVVMGRMLKKGENPKSTEITRNPNPKRPE